ncbi:SDR family NAD(P)-dependent oxidoreductase [Chloroflexi bacterium TSY]|nr:SDR family NAD(P)-dependent oxidoreductase [Chloroflexi bacterium TSY]
MFITGAGRGLGAGIARGLVQMGAHLCMTDIDETELGQTQDEIQSDGNNVLTIIADVSNFEAHE